MIDIKVKNVSLPYNLRSDYTLSKYIYNMTEKIWFVKVIINGTQGSGKTNLAMNLVTRLNKLYKNPLILYMRSRNIIPVLMNPEILYDLLDIKDYDVIIFVFDDFSYILTPSFMKVIGGNKSVLLSNYTQLRHFYNKKLITISTIHYKTAILPILRDTQMFVYTAVNSEMIDNIKNVVVERYFRKYLEWMNKFYMEDLDFYLESIIDNSIILNKGYDCMTISGINEVEKIKVLGGEYNIKMSNINERIALADLGSKLTFIYYNIILKNNKFDMSNINNFYVLNSDGYNEGIILKSDNNILRIKNLTNINIDNDLIEINDNEFELNK